MQTRLLILGLFISCIWCLAGAQSIELTILHTNDQHGHLVPFDLSGQRQVGGLSPRMTLIREVRAEVAKKHGYFLLLDAGDLNTGEPISDMFLAEPDIRIMNKMGYEVMAVGNHEFDLPLSKLIHQQTWAKFPYLSANIFYKEDGRLLFQPLIVWEIGGMKVAAFGITTPDTPDLSTCGNNPRVQFVQPDVVIPQILQILQGRVDFIIGLIHMDHDQIIGLAKKFPRIDMILSGHTHLPMAQALKVGNTWIVEAACYGMIVGRWDLQFQDKKLCQANYRPIAINLTNPLVDDQGQVQCPTFAKKFAPDPEVEAMLAPYLQKTDQLFNAQIATASDDLPKAKRGPTPQSSPLGNLIADAMREATQADAAFQNIGGIRGDLVKGPITYGSISRILPFVNTLFTCRLTGKQILELLAVVAQKDPNTGGFFEVAGIGYRIRHKTVQEVMIAGKPLELERTYKIVTNSFIAKGGDGYKIFDNFKKIDTGFLLSKIVMEYVQKKGIVHPNSETRMMWVE